MPDQIRTVLATYRDTLFTELFPGRDVGAEDADLRQGRPPRRGHRRTSSRGVRQGNDFCKKITYQTAESPKELIKRFRTDPMPRIAVTVDMIATGTDIKPLEA